MVIIVIATIQLALRTYNISFLETKKPSYTKTPHTRMYTNFYASVVMVALLSMQATPINLNDSADQAVFEPEQANTFAEINSAIMSYDGTA